MKLRYSPAVIITNNRDWVKADEKYQRDLLDTRLPIQTAFCREVRKDNARCLLGMKQYGLKEVKVSEADMLKIRRRAMTVYDDLSGKLYPPEFLAEVKERLALFRGEKKAGKSLSTKTGPEADLANRLSYSDSITEETIPEMGRKQAPPPESLRGVQEFNADKGPIEVTPAKLRTVQTVLKQLTIYTGIVDGIYGPKTRAAILDYQRRFGLPESGVLDASLWGHIENKDYE